MRGSEEEGRGKEVVERPAHFDFLKKKIKNSQIAIFSYIFKLYYFFLLFFLMKSVRKNQNSTQILKIDSSGNSLKLIIC